MAASDLSDPRAVIKAMREFDRLKRSKFLKEYKFGKAKEYMLRDPKTGHLYDSKAIVGVAHGYQFPKLGRLTSNDFRGGEVEVERKLKSLGFEVVRIGDDWTQAEVDAVVSDYFNMLALDVAGKPYNKAEHNRMLRNSLKSRSKGSVEMKHQNISAVLDERRLPYIEGYKPRYNYQSILKDSVVRFLDHRKGREAVRRIIEEAERVPSPSDWNTALVQAPTSPTPNNRKTAGKRGPRLPRRPDYATRDEQNRALGKAGEEWVCEMERRRLRDEGRADLADQVDNVAKSKGDGLGYDISSFRKGGSALYIEVKTTNGGIRTPFLISSGEVDFSMEEPKAFRLYRVFNFRKKPQLYILEGNLNKALRLEVSVYRAFPK